MRDLRYGLIKTELQTLSNIDLSFLLGVTFLFSFKPEAASMSLSENPSDADATLFIFAGVGCLTALPQVSSSLLCLPLLCETSGSTPNCIYLDFSISE